MKDDLVILSIIKKLYLELVMDYNALSLNVAAKKMFQKLKKKKNGSNLSLRAEQKIYTIGTM